MPNWGLLDAAANKEAIEILKRHFPRLYKAIQAPECDSMTETGRLNVSAIAQYLHTNEWRVNKMLNAYRCMIEPDKWVNKGSK